MGYLSCRYGTAIASCEDAHVEMKKQSPVRSQPLKGNGYFSCVAATAIATCDSTQSVTRLRKRRPVKPKAFKFAVRTHSKRVQFALETTIEGEVEILPCKGKFKWHALFAFVHLCFTVSSYISSPLGCRFVIN